MEFGIWDDQCVLDGDPCGSGQERYEDRRGECFEVDLLDESYERLLSRKFIGAPGRPEQGGKKD